MANAVLKVLKEEVDKTIDALSQKTFTPDPIAGGQFSKIVSVMSSAYKRHGLILERALLESLKQHDHLEVWEDRTFKVSQTADLMASAGLQSIANVLASTTPYGDQHRTLQVDTIVFDKRNRRLTAYEVKRGFGSYDSGKRRSIYRDLMCLHVLLRSYGQARDLDVANAHAHIIFYYGQCSIPKPFSLVREELDGHFDSGVVASIESVNRYFQKQLYKVLTT